MSATDDAISTQLKLLPQKWFLTIKKMTMTMSMERKSTIKYCDSTRESNWGLNIHSICAKAHMEEARTIKRKRNATKLHTQKKIQRESKKYDWNFLLASSYSSFLLWVFIFISIRFLNSAFMTFLWFFPIFYLLLKLYDCFYATNICQYLFMYMRFPLIEDLFVSNCIQQF